MSRQSTSLGFKYSALLEHSLLSHQHDKEIANHQFTRIRNFKVLVRKQLILNEIFSNVFNFDLTKEMTCSQRTYHFETQFQKGVLYCLDIKCLDNGTPRWNIAMEVRNDQLNILIWSHFLKLKCGAMLLSGGLA